MVPGDIMLLLMLIPSMLTALSVVREKELGSIANFYAAPATRPEFLGRQAVALHVGVALVQFATLVALAVFLFQVPIKGSWRRSSSAGVIYVLASTGFGLLISVFAPTQTAAIFAAAIMTILPRCSSPACSFRYRRSPGSMVRREDIPQHLFPGDQRRHIHQGPWL